MESRDEVDFTVVKDGWHLILAEAQEADRGALGRSIGEEKARGLGAVMDGTK